MTLAVRRIARIARRGSPAAAVRAVRRELALRRAEESLERDLRSSERLVVGPFLGEVGYELLYWRPWVLRLLRSHEVDPERVTVVARGGSGAWYRDVALRSVDAFRLLSASEVRRRMEERATRTGERKQVAIEALDRELAERAGGGALVHPLHMYWRSRFVWEGLRDPASALSLGDYDDLPAGELDPALAARLPERFVALKAYFNDCVPEGADASAALGRLVRALGRRLPVVLLGSGAPVDDHGEWSASRTEIVPIADLLRPETNLAQQAAVVARADALVATYGGFSYLGPLLGVPTAAFHVAYEPNRRHEAVLRAVRPQARFARAALADADGLVTAALG